jgi:hypothetical protein
MRSQLHDGGRQQDVGWRVCANRARSEVTPPRKGEKACCISTKDMLGADI